VRLVNQFFSDATGSVFPEGASLAVSSILSILVACAASGDPPCTPIAPAAPIPDWSSAAKCSSSQRSEWRDLGFPVGAAQATAVAATEQEVFVGTADGVWRRALDASADWSRAGLRGRYVRTLLTAGASIILAGAGRYDDTALPGTFHRSTDGARTWCSSGGDLFRYAFRGRVTAIPMEQLIRDPGLEGGGLGVLYANMTGASIAASRDGGATWQYVFLGPDLYGDPCVLHVTGRAPHLLYQGCEAPLDSAWIQSFDVSARSGVLANPTRIVTDQDIGNRRPNSFASSHGPPDIIYAGLEGALIRLQPPSWSWLYRYPVSGSAGFGRYTYIRFIWVDPCDPVHLVFGGGTQARNTFDLYETFDQGATLELIPPPADLGSYFLTDGARAGAGGYDFVVLVHSAFFEQPASSRVLIRHYRH
jgi:hypothetical protein